MDNGYRYDNTPDPKLSIMIRAAAQLPADHIPWGVLSKYWTEAVRYALDVDDRWFKNHPGKNHYTRLSLPGEFGPIAFRPRPAAGRKVIVRRDPEDGSRCRQYNDPSVWYECIAFDFFTEQSAREICEIICPKDGPPIPWNTAFYLIGTKAKVALIGGPREQGEGAQR